MVAPHPVKTALPLSDATSAPTPFAAKKSSDWHARINYPPRVLGCLYVLLILWSVLRDQSVSTVAVVAILAHTLLWPHVALWLAKRSRDPQTTERRNLLADCFFFGCWGALMDFRLLPGIALITPGIINNIAAYGLRRLLPSLVSTAAGVLLVGGLAGFQFIPDTTLLASLISCGGVVLYPSLVAQGFQRTNARLIELKRIVSEKVVALERSNRELDEFTYVASHDLKEPLRGISNYAHFLREDYGDRLDDAGRGMLDSLERQAQRLERLINDLRQYSQLGRAEFAVRETDLNSVLNDVLNSLALPIRENAVEVRIPQPLPSVRCDAAQASVIFRNLIHNAITYNDKPEKWIEIGWNIPPPASEGGPGWGRPHPDLPPHAGEGANGEPAFYVRDNGIGIKPGHQERVFTMFKRLHAKDAYGGGTGVGLTIAQKIVQMHGGRLWLESTPGEGATFFFTLGKAAG